MALNPKLAWDLWAQANSGRPQEKSRQKLTVEDFIHCYKDSDSFLQDLK